MLIGWRMKKMSNLEKVLEYVTKEENRYYELAGKEMDRNNTIGNMIMTAQAGAFQRVRYIIEDIMNGKIERKI